MFKRSFFLGLFLFLLPLTVLGQWTVLPVDTLTQHALGDTVFVDIELAGDGEPINALGFDLYFPDSLLQFNNFDFTGTLLESWMFKNVNQLDTNMIRVAGFTTTGAITAPVTGILLKTKFVIRENAAGEGIFRIDGFTDGLQNAITQPDTFQIWQNTPPIIRSEPVTFCLEDVRYEYLVDVFDPDPTDQLNFQLTAAPSWLGINSTTGLISGTPSNENVGQATVSFFVTDNVNPQVNQTYLLTVQNVNDPPTTPLALLSPAWGDTTSFANTKFIWRAGSDPDLNDVVSYYFEIYDNAALSNLIFSQDKIPDTTFAFSAIPDYSTKFQIGTEYFWRIQSVDLAGSQSAFTETNSFKLVNGEITNVPATLPKPLDFALLPNFPNPFNPRTMIKYQLAESQNVLLRIFNLTGRQVRLLADSHQVAGFYQLVWDGRNDAGMPVPSGPYILRLETSRFVANHKMLLLK